MVAGERNVLVGHEFVAGGVETTDSERPLTVGGTAQVARERFDGFDYVALGHLHRPQAVGGDAVRYAGSLLKYSTAEAEHTKSVAIVELGASGTPPRVEEVPLPVRRDVRTVTGPLASLVADAPPQGRDDYVFAVVSDTGPLYDPMGALRSVYPNCIGFTRERALETVRPSGLDAASLRSLDVATLFAGFFESVTGEPLTGEQRAEFVEVADDASAAEREA
jgi:exonuclease SbcD